MVWAGQEPWAANRYHVEGGLTIKVLFFFFYAASMLDPAVELTWFSKKCAEHNGTVQAGFADIIGRIYTPPERNNIRFGGRVLVCVERKVT